MRGIGGPLLCIGDLLSDVGECDGGDSYNHLMVDSPPSPSPPSSSTPSSSSSFPNLNLSLQPADLTKLFQEKYDHLNKALAGSDHSWTTLTLELCTALETASKLVHSTNSQVGLLLEKDLLPVGTLNNPGCDRVQGITLAWSTDPRT
ncbi:hypothetical protein Vadar_021739 [Vaccinium darrowii]|uniref:Uncharacterized protein n=1 Tax=Vaccinium darrowii TaxID=229202 RepID=A0ACB7Z671_9ERIC|nr:hypothetical protein Vadar_021739 [Vaccinium darrowii]